jgi:hypothetical protein
LNDIAHVVMDLAGVERIDVATLGGADRLNVGISPAPTWTR